MAKPTLKAWYTEAVSMQPQTPDYILPRMALTMVAPSHGDAFLGSCHGLAARALRDLHDRDKLTSDHSILMFGSGPTIFHTIVVEGDKVVFDALQGEAGNRYVPEGDHYFATRISEGVPLMHRLSVDDFFKDYVSKIVLQPAAAATKLTP